MGLQLLAFMFRQESEVRSKWRKCLDYGKWTELQDRVQCGLCSDAEGIWYPENGLLPRSNTHYVGPRLCAEGTASFVLCLIRQ
jgi:hypothetical protein